MITLYGRQRRRLSLSHRVFTFNCLYCYCEGGCKLSMGTKVAYLTFSYSRAPLSFHIPRDVIYCSSLFGCCFGNFHLTRARLGGYRQATLEFCTSSWIFLRKKNSFQTMSSNLNSLSFSRFFGSLPVD
jgi:hypothetical protein